MGEVVRARACGLMTYALSIHVDLHAYVCQHCGTTPRCLLLLNFSKLLLQDVPDHLTDLQIGGLDTAFALANGFGWIIDTLNILIDNYLQLSVALLI